MTDNAPAARVDCHAIFNNMAFADVVMAADRLMTGAVDGTVTTRQVASELGFSDSVVRPVMQRLVAAQMLDELPKAGASNGPRLFHRRNVDRWRSLAALIDSVAAAKPEPARRAARRT
jgi:hypothetical protein